MKRSLFLFVSSILAVAEGRMLTGLAELWAIEEPSTTFVQSDNTFTMDYGISDGMTPDNTRVNFFTEGCQNPTIGNAITVTDGIKSQVLVVSGTKGTLEFQLDTSILANNDKVYNNDGYPDKGVMKMCVRFMLWSGPLIDDNAIEVNYIESILTIDFDLTDGFELDGFAVIPKETHNDKGNVAEREAYTVDAYLCDLASFERIFPASFSQGSFISVCTELEENSDGIYLKSIDTFTWTREYTLGGVLTTAMQHAVENGIAADNGLTLYSCIPGSLICSFSSILMADFYATAGVVTGAGSVTMKFGGLPTARRRLAEKTGLRALEEDTDTTGSSDFDISIGVSTLDNGPGYQIAGGASPGTAGLIFFSIVLSALFLF